MNNFNAWRGTRLGCVGLLALWTLSACSVDAQDVEDTAEVSSALASEQQRAVFGFESAASWSASAGTAALSADHSEGSSSLSIQGAGHVFLQSQELGTVSDVSDTLLLDVQLPATPDWGYVQLYASSVSAGLNNIWLGQASLQGLSAGSFQTLSFPVTPAVKAALQQNVDVRFQIEVNQPSSAAATLIDNLRFEGVAVAPGLACAENAPFELTVQTSEDFDPELLERIQCRMYETYPLLVNRFNPDAASTVHLVNRTTGLLATGGNTIYYNTIYMMEHPDDLDAFVHEAMHVVQSGYVGGVPSWVIEGSADYVRDAYKLPDTDWALPGGWQAETHYTNSYRTTAAFFKWIDANYRVGQTPVVDALDDLLRERTYSPEMWTELTGSDVDTLWHLYSGGVAKIPAAEGQGITVYRHVDFVEALSTFGPGEYTSADMRNMGVKTNWISSLRVPAGFNVTVYADDNFSGTRHTYRGDRQKIDDMNDNIESIVVTKL
ncbi:basic secretory protein-like protein [Sorangium sp. So ce131]|uniref:basic secretory protein-like protein n=1 Tax=Sorangium sp. So ce131 TaxID=3133282 RepID=UPI003F6097FC